MFRHALLKLMIPAAVFWEHIRRLPKAASRW